jgi:hypothetical protein
VFLTMQDIQGISSHQLQMANLKNTVGQDNAVRFIEVFVQPIDLVKIKFFLVVF